MPIARHALAALAVLTLAAPLAQAQLAVGAKAPDFAADAALAGKPFRFSMGEALARGPVVLFFFPKAFTSGCTVEAKLFADATPRFAALGATVVGVSNDDLPTLQRFSTEACRDKFAVASDADSRVIKAYDAKLAFTPGMADRISYVVGRDGRVAYVWESLDPDEHVTRTMAAVEKLVGRAAPAAPK